jgi:hypothetical protein
MTTHGQTSPDVYVHVPKTAGTSLRQAVIAHYGSESVYVYSQATDRLISASKGSVSTARPGGVRVAGILERMPRAVMSCAVFAGEKLKQLSATPENEAFADASAIIGHFTVDRFAELQTAHSANMHTVVREPLARMVSHYRHVQRSGRTADHHLSWQTGQDVSAGFETFALSETVRNFQTGYTGTDIGRYALVGTTENVGTFMVAAGVVPQENDVPHANQAQGASAGMDIISDPGFVRDFREFHADDYAFYEEAASRALLPIR